MASCTLGCSCSISSSSSRTPALCFRWQTWWWLLELTRFLRANPVELTMTADGPHPWPPDEMVEQTPELVEAGNRVASWISCGVCEARAMSLLDQFRRSLLELRARGDEAEDMEDFMGGSRALCRMEDLSKLMQAQGLEVVVGSDGSASLKRPRGGLQPAYAKRIDKRAFHYKSYGIQKACSNVFRKGLGVLAAKLWETHKAVLAKQESELNTLMAMGKTVRTACKLTPPCLEESKRRAAQQAANVKRLDETALDADKIQDAEPHPPPPPPPRRGKTKAGKLEDLTDTGGSASGDTNPEGTLARTKTGKGKEVHDRSEHSELQPEPGSESEGEGSHCTEQQELPKASLSAEANGEL